MYPFTPIELHEGVLIGRKRILTTHSVRFDWGNNTIFEVYVFDGDSIEIEPNVQFYLDQQKGMITELLLPLDGVATLIRRKNYKKFKKCKSRLI